MTDMDMDFHHLNSYNPKERGGKDSSNAALWTTFKGKLNGRRIHPAGVAGASLLAKFVASAIPYGELAVARE